MNSQHVLLAALLAVGLGACDPALPDASAFIDRDVVVAMPLRFEPYSATPSPQTDARLQALRATLPPAAQLSLKVTGRLGGERANAVAAELGRPVSVLDVASSKAGGIDAALLTIETRRLISSACLEAGQPVPRDLWPGHDANRPRSMPPGCAADNAIQQMAVQQDDLQRGRPLAPGAALPIARAIERYYARSETAPAAVSQASPASSPASPGPTPAPAASGGGDGAGLLQGPLTPAAPSNGETPASSPAQ